MNTSTEPTGVQELRKFIADNGEDFDGGRMVVIKYGPLDVRMCVGVFSDCVKDVCLWVEHPDRDGTLGGTHRHLLQRHPTMKMVSQLLAAFTPDEDTAQRFSYSSAKADAGAWLQRFYRRFSQ